ncbi:MAG: MazG family protein [Clostridia bacterium]|nr:MazG family protein [Clostridia bacterium]
MKTKSELLKENKHDFNSLVSVMAALRSEGGCPWDIEQTHSSVRKCLIEETYEVIEAIDKHDPALLREELGDLMFQVVFHARIEDEEGRFNIDDVVHDITHKMITRHPHVFAETVVSDSDEVIVNWDNIKREEKSLDSPVDILKRVPPYMPALLRAEKVQGKALKKFNYGIATPDKAICTIENAVKNGLDRDSIGDLLMGLTAYAEMQELDLEEILTNRINAFIEGVENKS